MLQQAQEAIHEGQFAHARDILTNLLRVDQQNPDYWVWLSAGMETQKERLYCLQTAIQMDPTNIAAQRGLILMGAVTPDDAQKPFPLNHARPWESKIKLTEDKDKPSNLKKVTSSAGFRLGAAIGVGALVFVGVLIGVGVMISKGTVVRVGLTGTPRPTVTPYATNSNQSSVQTTALPLAEFVLTPYTPTPIYAATPHGDAASDSYRGAMRAYKDGQWDMVGIMMAQVATAQPGSVDAMYFIGEANRLSGKYKEAVENYNRAIEINSNFAPSYLGRALANLAINPNSKILDDLNQAINLDPNYAEAYMQRGLYFYNKRDYPTARLDLEQASGMITSPLVELNLARILLAQGENEAALAAAKRANGMDATMLDAYLVLGNAYRANGQIDQAVYVLETYLKYQPDNAEAFTLLGAAYVSYEDYDTAKKDLQQALRLDKFNWEANYWYGQTNLALKDYDSALASFRIALQYNPDSFDAGEGLAKAYMAKGEFNNSYIAIIKVEQLAKTEAERARFVYIRALSLDQLKQRDAAYRDWNEILALPVDATTLEMRDKAQLRLVELRSPTPEPPTATITRTPSPTATLKPTNTIIPTSTRVPTSTPKK